MNILQRYRLHLTERATGLSRLEWYRASAIEGVPSILIVVALVPLSSLAPEQYQIAAAFAAVLPGFIGWSASQAFMASIHMKDLKERSGPQD